MIESRMFALLKTSAEMSIMLKYVSQQNLLNPIQRFMRSFPRWVRTEEAYDSLSYHLIFFSNRA